MTPRRPMIDEDLREAAARWVVALRAPEAGEAEWLAFEAWLEGGHGRRMAYDQATALWEDIDAHQAALRQRLQRASASPVVSLDSRRPRRAWMAPAATIGALAAAAVAALAIFVPGRPSAPPVSVAAPAVYATAKGERRSLTLEDGSRIDLNGASRISVRYLPERREVTLDDAEAAFDVAHDAARPFIIRVGPRTVRVVGTQFDVLRHEGRTAVTVRRGIVEVAEAAAAPVRLTAGRRLRAETDSAPAVMETVAETEAQGWRTGRLIYRQQPFGDVVSDLGRYFDEPLRIEGDDTAALRFSGVLVVGREDEIIRRIEALLAVSATRDGGAIVFRSNDASR